MTALVETACALLGARWGETPPVRLMLADMADRATFASTVGGRDVIVKVDAGSARFSREWPTLLACRAAAIPVPEVVLAEPGPPSVLVLTQVAGIPLPLEPVAGWREAGLLLRRIHHLDPPGPARFDHREASWREFVLWWSAHEADRCVGAGLVGRGEADDVVRRLVASFEAMREPERCFLHGDAQPDHLLVNGDGAIAAIVDFGDASTGDPAWDLAVLTLSHPHRLAAVLEGYEPAAAVAEHVASIVPAYRMLRDLGAATWLHDHGFSPSPALHRLHDAMRAPAPGTTGRRRPGRGRGL